MKKKLLALLLCAMMLLSLVACGGGSNGNNGGNSGNNGGGGDVSDGGGTEEEQVFRSLYASECTTLNYLITTQTVNTGITYNVVDCLVEYDPYANVEPALATSWESNDDASVWTFHIREGLKWVDKDGNEVADVTANDWVAAARYVVDAKNDSSLYSANMKGIIAGAQEYYDYTAYLLALETATDGTDENGNPCKIVRDEEGNESVLEEVPEASIEDLGVRAVDDHTVEYTLASPRAYFVSMVSMGCFMPVYEPFLEECGEKFGTSNEYLLYCGAYYLSSFKPQEEHVLTKNPHYWEPEKVYIDKIQSTYNAEASSISLQMYLDGDLDTCSVQNDLLSAMLQDPQTSNLLHPSRKDTSYSYWFLFNFDPNFEDEYEPENWKKAVNNENFRQSILHAINRVPAMAASDPTNPTASLNKTITPDGFASYNGKDFTAYGGLDAYASGDNFDEDLAKEYRDKAKTELTAAGATFPIKVLFTYNPNVTDWANECQVVEQQVEGLLGADYVDFVVEAGPSDGFLKAVRGSGKYAFMKCNWGADYADPETWTDPFQPGSSYCFIDKSTDPATMALYQEYCDLVATAKTIVTDIDARYEAFAKAEAFLLDHAFALPIHVIGGGYVISNLNPFEGQYAPFGGASARYKDQHILETSMSMDEWNKDYEEWSAKAGG